MPHTAPPPQAITEAGVHAASLLGEITAGLSAGSDLAELLQRFLEPVVRLAGAQGGALRLLSESDERLRLVSQDGPTPERCGADRPVDRHCGHCGQAADGARVVWAADPRACHDGSDLGDAAVGNPAAATAGLAVGTDPASRSMLSVPLQHRGHVLGVYNLFYAQPKPPTAAVQALLKSVGELLGLALHNARLEAQHLRATLLRERQMLAAEVHDSVAQSLAFVRMRLPLLHDAMRARDDAGAQRYYEDLRSAVSQAHSGLRGLLTDLRSPMDPQGLAHALGASVDAFRRGGDTELDFINDWPGLRLGAEQELQVFHIVQEALNNIRRHARARHASLHIAKPQRGELEIVIEDDGAGLAASPLASSAHYGLEIMGERARHIGGSLRVGARQGGGTRVQLQFPLLPAATPGGGAAASAGSP